MYIMFFSDVNLWILFVDVGFVYRIDHISLYMTGSSFNIKTLPNQCRNSYYEHNMGLTIFLAFIHHNGNPIQEKTVFILQWHLVPSCHATPHRITTEPGG